MSTTDSTWWKDRERSISITLFVYDYMCNNTQYRVTAMMDITTWWMDREQSISVTLSLTLCEIIYSTG